MTNNRWLDWQPGSKIFHDSANTEATEPTKPSSVSFVGSTSGKDQKTCEPSEAEISAASSLLNRAACRYIVDLETRAERIGIWSDLDSAELREALRALRIDLPVVYLDSERCPDYYKTRRVPGEPVPLSILAAMEQAQSEPWRVRDELLAKAAPARRPLNQRTHGMTRS